MTKVSGPAIAVLLEKVIIGTSAVSTIGFTASADGENSGPRSRAACSASADSAAAAAPSGVRSEEHTSELQSLMRISYAVFCLKKKNMYHYMQITSSVD